MVRATAAAAAPRSRVDDLPDATWRSLLGRGMPQFTGEALGPVLVFYAAWELSGLTAAIVASTLFSIAIAAWLLRRGKDATPVALGALVVVMQAAVGLASHSATVYLAQPVVLSGLWSIAYFGSVVVRRPLIGVFANAWYPVPGVVPRERAVPPRVRDAVARLGVLLHAAGRDQALGAARLRRLRVRARLDRDGTARPRRTRRVGYLARAPRLLEARRGGAHMAASAAGRRRFRRRANDYLLWPCPPPEP